MLYQTLDGKSECVGIYANGELHYDQFPEGLTHTWDFSPHLKDLDIQYATIYCGGKTLDEVCPLSLKDDLDRVTKKLRAFLNSFEQSKVSLKENCVFDLIPERFLKEYCEIKNRISEHVFKTYKAPKDYDFYRNFTAFINNISTRELNIDKGWLSEKLYDVQAKRLWEKVTADQTKIKYNMFGSVTGRLTVGDTSFPILNLNKNLRTSLKPKNDWFVELDLNAAELRIAQALMGRKQVIGDFHEWSAKNIFRDELTRTEAKEAATQWLYNSQSKNARKYDSELEAVYKKQAMLTMYHIDGAINTPFGRNIPCDEYHAISYLNQSTLIDLFHRQILKMNAELEKTSSFVAFMVHDSVVLDLSDSDKTKLPEFIRLLSDTKYGNFPVNVKIGTDYGNMKKMKIKV